MSLAPAAGLLLLPVYEEERHDWTRQHPTNCWQVRMYAEELVEGTDVAELRDEDWREEKECDGEGSESSRRRLGFLPRGLGRTKSLYSYGELVGEKMKMPL